MTQERSKVIKETENPFGDEEEEKEEERALALQQRQAAAGPSSRGQQDAWQSMASAVDKSNMMKAPSSSPQSSGHKKSKSKPKNKGRKTFHLEEEKEKMMSIIAESSMASTGLMNSLQTINRERERISENRTAVQHFEACKTLRRRILRYVSFLLQFQFLSFLHFFFFFPWSFKARRSVYYY